MPTFSQEAQKYVHYIFNHAVFHRTGRVQWPSTRDKLWKCGVWTNRQNIACCTNIRQVAQQEYTESILSALWHWQKQTVMDKIQIPMVVTWPPNTWSEKAANLWFVRGTKCQIIMAVMRCNITSLK